MARYEIEDRAPETIAKIAAAFDRKEDFDIAGNSIGWNIDNLVATDTTIAEWTAARGCEPTREGDLYVFDQRRDIQNPTKQGRTMTVGTVVYVLEIDGCTVAEA